MSANTNGQFREDELVTRRMKVNGEWQTRTFPVVGGRLRLGLPPIAVPLFKLVSRVYGPPSEMISSPAYSGQ